MNEQGTIRRAAFNDHWSRPGWAVLGAKARTSRNRLAVRRRKNPVRTTAQLIVACGTIGGITALLTVGFAATLRLIDDDALATTLLASLLAIYMLAAFIGSSTAALQALYLADDIPFLLTLPIPLRALFGSKFVEAAVGTLPPGILFVAAMLGYGSVRTAGPLYWLVGVAVGVSTIALTTSFSVMVVSAVTRYIPPRRARIFLLAIGLLLVTSTLAAWVTLSPRPDELGSSVSKASYEPLWNWLSMTPMGWGATSMSDAASGRLSESLAFCGILVGTSVVTVSLSFRFFRMTFVRGLSQTRAVQAAAPNDSLTGWLRRLGQPLPRRLGAMVLKEWLVFFRDLRRLAGAIWPVGIVLVYTVALGRGGVVDFGSPDLEFWARNGSLALLPWGLSLGISVYSFGSEGRNIQLLRSLPLSPSRIFLAKVIASLLPVGTVGLGAASISLWVRQAPLVPSLQLLLLMAWMVTGFVVIDCAGSAFDPIFEADQVQRTIGLTGRLFSFFLGGVFAAATLTAAGRLVLMDARPPASLDGILSTSAGGVEVFGWPLIAAMAAAACAVLGLAIAVAIRETDRLISSGA